MWLVGIWVIFRLSVAKLVLWLGWAWQYTCIVKTKFYYDCSQIKIWQGGLETGKKWIYIGCINILYILYYISCHLIVTLPSHLTPVFQEQKTGLFTRTLYTNIKINMRKEAGEQCTIVIKQIELL